MLLVLAFCSNAIVFGWTNHIISCYNKNSLRFHSNFKLKMIADQFQATLKRPQMYKSIQVTVPNLQSKVSLLVKNEYEKSVSETIESWKAQIGGLTKKPEDEINEWIDRGMAFLSTPEGTRSIYKSEYELARHQRVTSKGLPKRNTMAAEVYVNTGTKDVPVYVKASEYSKGKVVDTEFLRHKGLAFTNVSQLFTAETVLNRADSIALKLKSEYSITSPEWRRWTNRTAAYNATSLTQVFAEYFSAFSIGDVGGKDVAYTPKRGYPGTLAPGEEFKEDCPFDGLPKRVLHPWPAMQEFQWHVRWPPSHPMIPPPLLWAGLNNMYTENFTNWESSKPCAEVVGGSMMEPKHAIRIARTAKFGLSYIPSEQLPHGGMIFDSGFKIPHYNPDHGPTVTEEEAANDIPDRLIPTTQTWMDPLFGMEMNFVESVPANESPSQREERMDEVSSRRLAAEKMLAARYAKKQEQQIEIPPKKFPLWQTQQEEEAAEVEREVEEKLSVERAAAEKDRLAIESSSRGAAAVSVDEIAEGAVPGYVLINANVLSDVTVGVLDSSGVSNPRSVEYWDHRRESIRSEIETSKQLTSVASGNARSTRQLITYTIASIRNMQVDIMNGERDLSLVKKSFRKGRKKSRVAESADDDDDFALRAMEEETAFPDSGDSYE